jgi:molecular chaperone DnaK (HSP70)
MNGWAIDLGNSHSRVARWDTELGAPRLLELPAVCREPGGTDPLAAPRLVPSAIEIIAEPDWRARLGRWPVIARRWFLGRQAVIGRPALQRNAGMVLPGFVPTFKPFLDREALRPIARVGRRTYTARDVAHLYIRELLAEIRRAVGLRLRDVVLTTPVDAYETYRAELLRIARALGLRRVRFIDEPVAAALGYGLGLSRDRRVLVVDFGGGTLHFALVSLCAREAEAGASRVLAKEGRPLGGNLVNQWLLDEFCRRLGFDLSRYGRNDEMRFWRQLMLTEACRVKEQVFFKPAAVFHLTPPTHLRGNIESVMEDFPWLEVTREELEGILRRNGLYDTLADCLASVTRQAAMNGAATDDIDEVLMVGGSTLLPGVYPFFEKRFGRDRVRAWQPFEAVAYGASAYAADSFSHADFIVHDYAFVTYDPQTHEKRYTVIVPRGTRFPTPRNFWHGQLVPTCALGEPETIFKLVVCEMGADGQGKFQWDKQGRLHQSGDGRADPEPVVVPLNESHPTLGRLDPPHSPRDRRPRLEVSFAVNDQRWLCVTVHDLQTGKWLLKDSRVIRLL